MRFTVSLLQAAFPQETASRQPLRVTNTTLFIPNPNPPLTAKQRKKAAGRAQAKEDKRRSKSLCG